MTSIHQLNGEAVAGLDPAVEPDAFRGQGGVAGGSLGTESDWGFFAIGATSRGDHKDTENLVGGDFDIQDLTIGADCRVDENLVLGVAFGTDTSETDFDDMSRLESTTVTVGGYGTLLLSENLYLDGMVSFGLSDLETARRVAGNVVADGDTDATVFSTKWRLVYEEKVEDFTISPELTLHYAYAEVDDYAERGGGGASLNVDRQDAKSLTSGLGVKVYYETEVQGIPLVPHLGVSWIHEFEDNSRRVTTAFTGAPGTPFETTIDGPDKNYFDCTLGVTALLRENVRLYLDYHTLAANEQVRSGTLRAGMRLSF